MTGQVSGLASGLDTASIIRQLMQIERQPEQTMLAHQTQDKTMVSILQALNATLVSLNTAATAFVPDPITGASSWQAMTATTSNTSIVTATAGTGAVAGSVTFTVGSVASAGAAVTTGSVSAPTDAVGLGPILVGKGIAALGIADLQPGSTLATGSHTIQVTQSSAGASITGGAVASSVTIDGTNNQVQVYLDGSATTTTYTLTAGTYTPTQLAQELSRASGGQLNASVGASGGLVLTTTEEGSAATMQVASANTALGLTDTTTVAHGTDAVVSVDGQSQTFTDLVAGGQITLTGANGDTMVATLAGGLRAGTGTATLVNVASGATLADVAQAITSSTAGVSAAAVAVGTGAYKLQLTSTTTGAGTDVTVNSGAFGGGLGNVQQLTAASDTVLHVGSGAGAYDVTSPSSTVTNWLPGITLSVLKADPATPVTLNVTSDASGITAKMKSLVDAANSVLSSISSNSGYDASSKTAGALLGDPIATGLQEQIWNAVTGTSTSTPSIAGVEVQKDGTISFDQAKFEAAYAADPVGTQASMTAMAQQLASVATAASDPIDGEVTQQITSYQDDSASIDKQIADFEVRMSLKQAQLQTEFDNLETALSQMQAQSSWLTSQLGGLSGASPSPSSASK